MMMSILKLKASRTLLINLTLLGRSLVLLYASILVACAQSNSSPNSGAVVAKDNSGIRNIVFSVPGDRGGIFAEYEGKLVPLAKTGEANYLAISFRDVFGADHKATVTKYVRERLDWMNSLLGRQEKLDDQEIWEYFWSRRRLPMRVGSVLSEQDTAKIEKEFSRLGFVPPGIEGITRRLRSYPEQVFAAHILGRMRLASPADWVRSGPIQEKDLIYPEQVGGTGLERAFNDLLKSRQNAKIRQLIDAKGNILKEEHLQASIPGRSLILTLDPELQGLAEAIVEDRYKIMRNGKAVAIKSSAHGRPKGFVLIDVKDMSIAAMASSPTFDLKRFSPGFYNDNYEEQLKSNPARPLDSRSFEFSYPPASTFKIVTSLMALESGVINEHDRFQCPPALRVSHLVMRNHVSENVQGESPYFDIRQAIRRSCNTWFFQVANKVYRENPEAFEKIFTIAHVLGLGNTPDIQLPGSTQGFVPSSYDDFKNSDGKHRPLHPVEIANMAIGQGNLSVSPLQMATLAARLANPESNRKLSLIRSIYDSHNNSRLAFDDYLRQTGALSSNVPLSSFISPRSRKVVLEAMFSVVNSSSGTATRAVRDLDYQPSIAAKTGTGQWSKGRYVAWLTGFFPYQAPRYAFAILVEGAPGQEISGGQTVAPLLNAFLSSSSVKRRIENHVKETVSRGEALIPLPVTREESREEEENFYRSDYPSSPSNEEVQHQEPGTPQRSRGGLGNFFRNLFERNR